MITIADLQKELVEELGLDNLSAEDQERVLNEAGGMIYQRILLSVFEKIPAAEHDKLTQLITADLEDEITELVHKHVPNVEEVVEVEMQTSIDDLKRALLS